MELKRILFFALSLSILLSSTIFPKRAFADPSGTSSESEEAEPYSPDEFPGWSKKVRRAEVITLGSVPFTTLGVILVYGTYQYVKGESVSFPNPFDSSKTYSERQIKMILGYSAAASCAIGLTDFMITFIKEKHTQKKLRKIRESTEQPTVTPITPEEAGNLLRQGTINAQKADKAAGTKEAPSSESPNESTSPASPKEDKSKSGQGE
ncbi:MAG: hypothetical protein K6E22_04640 [Treponema sp.]|nr:hypothetical protein [Treponema sp.]